ncbi:MAG: hypothetical protein F4X40_01605 [Chloroflexi bacterium]|nr:hypothetical protein [Chloroflexota bacterium]
MAGERWHKDETILALHLYISNGRRYLKPELPEVTSHVAMLGSLGFPDRSADTISLKMKNFIWLDPGKSEKGLSHVGPHDAEIWKVYSASPDALKREVTRIKKAE